MAVHGEDAGGVVQLFGHVFADAAHGLTTALGDCGFVFEFLAR
jgi:hypothetical protein